MVTKIADRLDALSMQTVYCIQGSKNATYDKKDAIKDAIIADWNGAASLLREAVGRHIIDRDNHCVCTVCKQWSETAAGIEHDYYCFVDRLQVAIYDMEGPGDE